MTLCNAEELEVFAFFYQWEGQTGPKYICDFLSLKEFLSERDKMEGNGFSTRMVTKEEYDTAMWHMKFDAIEQEREGGWF